MCFFLLKNSNVTNLSYKCPSHVLLVSTVYWNIKLWYILFWLKKWRAHNSNLCEIIISHRIIWEKCMLIIIWKKLGRNACKAWCTNSIPLYSVIHHLLEDACVLRYVLLCPDLSHHQNDSLIVSKWLATILVRCSIPLSTCLSRSLCSDSIEFLTRFKQI